MIENEFLDKEVSSCKKSVLLGLFLAVLTTVLFYSVGLLKERFKAESIPFSNAYEDERLLSKDIYVYVDVSIMPRYIGYVNSREYYYIADEDGIYIMSCHDSTYSKIREAVSKNKSYKVIGVMEKISNEATDKAIAYYNRMVHDPDEQFTAESFNSYFCDRMVSVGPMSYKETGVFIIAVFVGITAFGLLFIGCIVLFRYNKTQDCISGTEAAIINEELKAPETEYMEECHTYLTPNYIVSFGYFLVAVKYSDILWAYREDHQVYLATHTCIKILNKDFETFQIADMQWPIRHRDYYTDYILETIEVRNPEVVTESGKEYEKYFKKMQRGY